jgi:hypothetical protein
MNELWVPTHASAAEVRCSDGRVFAGRIFIPESSSHHSGPMRIDEWFNEGGPFFAFLPDDAKSTVFFGKNRVAILSVAPALDEVAVEEEIEVPRRRVAVELADRRVEGELLIDMPQGQRRVLDYLNRAEPFLTLRAGDRWYLVRKSLITRVIETQEA